MDVIELRQYRMKRQRRDEMIELFEQHFVEGQEAHGMAIYGQFCVKGDANAFVWMRGFASMDARREALSGFYGGPLWAEHRDAANATMDDVSNVLLLRPEGPGFADARPSVPRGGSVILATVEPRDAVIQDRGGDVLGTFVSLHAENTFPRLPIREGEDVRVTFQRFPDVACVPALDVEHVVLLPTARSWLR